MTTARFWGLSSSELVIRPRGGDGKKSKGGGGGGGGGWTGRGGKGGIGGGGGGPSSAFPTLVGTAETTRTIWTNHTMPVIAGEVGDLLITVAVFNGDSGFTISGWTALTSIGNTPTSSMYVLYRIATGVADYPQYGVTGTDRASALFGIRLRGAAAEAPQFAVISTKSSADPTNIPIVTPSWGSAKTQWWTFTGWRDGAAIVPVSSPTGWTNLGPTEGVGVSAWQDKSYIDAEAASTPAAQWDWPSAADKQFLTLGVRPV